MLAAAAVATLLLSGYCLLHAADLSVGCEILMLGRTAGWHSHVEACPTD